ncbi:NADPH-dependent assimilatory sulfite reductase hemoprotein subunit [Hymenobacter taeanensis]|uniref:Sulfite reductase [NADPH] hemoprotein beta-component n=1 Tax=Hymenobacter taeanensis TaxID=2735321 RepID=A0A6M6BJK0_9BACT|nr:MULTISPECIES: NADPH-dependent assimilatory sulfite reductase hemoprotein subunit [Hymenobacter]QJX48240.1 NADPH-dependent assimilatory sulfite reductase hemoprotein subunit [Hymenobacter taeanensis]UOQ82280.1 NADPH-dependent assimilatory sulfite reductase hemoprotein subunit [Hymenobacter sp. 5414T-23]
MADTQKLSEVEHVKDASNYLRGTLAESIVAPLTGALNPDDTHLIKFHGSYQQTDRDLDSERKRQKLEPLYSLMIRVRVPGGVASAAQWERMDALADQYGNGTLKLTTRQAFQLHGVLKRNLKKTIQGFNAVLLDSISGCGDVNRNVMFNPNPHQSKVHEEVYEITKAIGAHLTPRTSAYWELWLDGEPEYSSVPNEGEGDFEPIYGKTYLPRKFKIALAVPPHNDTDIFANDLGLIAIEDQGRLLGFNVAVGGGMGMTFGMPETYPRLGDLIGYVPADKVVDVCEKVVTIQRDWGNRENRKFSRLKYTLDRVGLDVFKQELNQRLGFDLEPARAYEFKSSGDAFGWTTGPDGAQHLTLFVEGGRIADRPGQELKTALREISRFHTGDFRLTGNQNLILANVAPEHKLLVQTTLAAHGIQTEAAHYSGLRRGALACVALNTCSLAFAEAERYIPQLIDRLDGVLAELGLLQDDIIIRMTGCPNGCARPYLGEIGLVGRAVGRYNLYLGAGFNGERMNKLYKEMLDEDGIVETLTPLLQDYAQHRQPQERFGDFVIRQGYVQPTTHGLNFHV